MDRFRFNYAIGLYLIIILLLQATYNPTYATNSTTNSTAKPTNSTFKPAKTLSISISTIKKIKTNSTKALESSKKDKRQAHRGFTDISFDERSFDEVVNSSPSPLPNFESDLPTIAADESSASTTTSNYLPNPLDRNPESSFFSPRLGYPPNLPNLPKLQDIPGAATTVVERRDDFFDSSSGDGKAIPGEAERDYPTFASIPKTSFSCKDQQWPGYYADTEARCQVFWICQKNRMDAFLCPNGTLFNQQVFVCDWWFNVECNASPGFYSRNQFLYSGPGVGIDGSPTKLRGPPGNSVTASASNTFVANQVSPRPNNINLNIGNHVQSSNNVPRVASVNLNQGTKSPFQLSSSNGFTQNQNYLASSSQQPSIKFSTPINNNLNQPQFQSNRHVLSNNNQIQKNLTTASSQIVGNSFTGDYKQQKQQQSIKSPLVNDLDRRTFGHNNPSPTSGGYLQGNFTNNFGTGQRTDQFSFHSSSTAKPPTATPKLNVNIDNKGSNKAVITFSGTISSTARPATFSTQTPYYNQGSSTLQTPKDNFQIRQPINNNAAPIPNNNVRYQYNNNNNPTTSAPITTTFRSTSTVYKSQMGYDLTNQRPSPSPNNVINRHFESSTGAYLPSPPSTTQAPPAQSNYNGYNTGFLPSQTQLSTTNAPTQLHTTLNPTKGYVDRFGYVQKNQHQTSNSIISSTSRPKERFSFNHEKDDFTGQRSNQFSNYNGQREIMYSQSQINANIEYPYSPSQQKNKQRRLELELLKGFSTPAKDLFAYPHFHGQRSNAYSDSDTGNEINDDAKQDSPKIQLPSGHINDHISSHQQFPQGHFQNTIQHNQIHFQQQQQQHSPQSTATPPNSHNTFIINNSPSQSPPQHHFNPQQQSQTLQFHSQSNQQQPQQQFPNTQPSFQNSQQQHGQFQPSQHFQSQQPTGQTHQQHFQPSGQPQHFNPQTTGHQFSKQINIQPQPTTQSIQHNFINSQPQQKVKSSPPQEHFSFQQPDPQNQFNAQSSNAAPQQHQFDNQENRISQNPQQHQQIFPQQSQHFSPSQSPPFHQRIVEIPAQNLQLPFSRDASALDQRDGYTALKSGSFISVAASPSPFSKQIIQTVTRKEEKGKPTNFIAPTPPPNGLVPFRQKQDFHSSGLSSTVKPHQQQRSQVPFETQTFSFSKSVSVTPAPTPFANQNHFIASPTQSPLRTTSPGHRSNAFLPHGPKKQKQQKQQQHSQRQNSPHTIQYPNSVISTTIKYPEGTGSLKLGVPGASNSKRLVDFSYSANPKAAVIKTQTVVSTTSFPPTVTERYNSGGSNTRRPNKSNNISPSSSPKYNKEGPRKSGARLAGSVINKSTSSTSAIYVDTSATAESVSTPVSIPPAPTPSPPRPLSTSNFGSKISATAKKRMSGAWQNYFNENRNQTAPSSS